MLPFTSASLQLRLNIVLLTPLHLFHNCSYFNSFALKAPSDELKNDDAIMVLLILFNAGLLAYMYVFDAVFQDLNTSSRTGL